MCSALLPLSTFEHDHEARTPHPPLTRNRAGRDAEYAERTSESCIPHSHLSGQYRRSRREGRGSTCKHPDEWSSMASLIQWSTSSWKQLSMEQELSVGGTVEGASKVNTRGDGWRIGHLSYFSTSPLASRTSSTSVSKAKRFAPDGSS